jgi:hypothetical protein
MAEAQRLGGWMTRFKRCIDPEARAAASKKVIIKPEQFDGTSDYKQEAEWIRTAVPGGGRGTKWRDATERPPGGKECRR